MSDGSTNWGSAIMLILQGEYVQFSKTPFKHQTISGKCKAILQGLMLTKFPTGTKEEHLNMLEGGIIAKLLDEKWTTYAKVGIYMHISR